MSEPDKFLFAKCDKRNRTPRTKRVSRILMMDSKKERKKEKRKKERKKERKK